MFMSEIKRVNVGQFKRNQNGFWKACFHQSKRWKPCHTPELLGFRSGTFQERRRRRKKKEQKKKFFLLFIRLFWSALTFFPPLLNVHKQKREADTLQESQHKAQSSFHQTRVDATAKMNKQKEVSAPWVIFPIWRKWRNKILTWEINKNRARTLQLGRKQSWHVNNNNTVPVIAQIFTMNVHS